MITTQEPGSGITSGRLADVPFAERTVGRLLERAAQARPDDVFVTHDRVDHTLAEVNARVDVLAAGLRARGVGPGSRVGLLMATGVEYLYGWFALAKLGAVEVPINTAYRGELLAHQLHRARVGMVIADRGSLADAVDAVRGEVPTITEVLTFPGGYSDLLDGDAAEVQAAAAPSDVACVLYTSGTTGPSKGVLVSQHQQVVFGHLFAEITGLRADDVMLNYSPFFHISGKFTTLGCLLSGARMVLRTRLSIERFWDEVREYGITGFVAIGGVCHMLHGRAPRPDDADNPVRVVYAVPAPAEIYHDFERRFGLKLVEAYGSTETNLIVNSSLTESLPGACGRPNPVFDVRVVDSSGDEVPDGASGEIVVRSRTHCCSRSATTACRRRPRRRGAAGGSTPGTGPSATRAARCGSRTGSRTPSAVAARTSRPTRSSAWSTGTRRSPSRAAVGAPSELGEEEVRVVVVLRDGAAASPEDLYLHYAASMPYHMVPRYIDIVDALPRTPTDKVEKYKLRSAGVGETTWDASAAGWRTTRDGPVRTT